MQVYLSLFVFYLMTRIPKLFRPGGIVVNVIDGDTIIVRRWFFINQKIRLAEIDAPEISQKYGYEAKSILGKIIPVGSRLTIEYCGKGKHKRKLAHIYNNGVHVNHVLVANGVAWVYDDYSNDIMLKRTESYAKRKHRGFWKSKKPVPPWMYRKGFR